jgi:hypothetical protein
MSEVLVFASSGRLVARNILFMLLLLNMLFGSIALANNLPNDSLTYTSLVTGLPAVQKFLLFLLPLEVSYFLLYIAGCYIRIIADAQVITIYKPLALFGRTQVQPLAGLEAVTIASFKSKGFVFQRVAAKAERIEFDFLPKAALASFAAFLQRQGVATSNF